MLAVAQNGSPFVTDEAGSERLWLRRVVLTQFRSYERAEITVDERPVVLTGVNGAGKTNLLEAISLMTPGRGLRGGALSEISRIVPEGTLFAWAVAAEVCAEEEIREVGTGRDPLAMGTGGRERRLIKIDGEVCKSQQALAEVLSAVWLTPQMDSLLRDSASGRRRFLDRLVLGFDPEHAANTNAYEHALRERARLLKGGSRDLTWISTLEDRMARYGIAVSVARREITEKLQHACAETHGDFPVAGLVLQGAVEEWLEDKPALIAEEELRRRLYESRSQDTITGGASWGPHKSDLLVHHLEKAMPAGLCSTGEQKALLLSIVLAHARLVMLERGASPLLLLDEVVAHLDEKRRDSLFEEILNLRCQAWMTGTDADVFAAMGDKAQHLSVKDRAVFSTAVRN
ncbi:DNA replication/repair protein RecF [Kiloniella laminariae]|uniref:DNA replication and repair protein RecF n=1 Tax=Kiloniella laminariae TaxID=454162 RepID=A0ABT4LIP3_9PROT|nr:DNA replication/repair protein RecF [Kiloniella laminariae]MCZ4280976.1 DNA replication/repair protein RecF [Kiloniella laminariae]